MTYHHVILLILIIASLAVAFATFIYGIVSACRKKWRSVMWSVILIALCLGFSISGGAYLTFIAGRAAVSKVAQIRHQQLEANRRRQDKIETIQLLTLSTDWSKVDREFWDYDGSFDWWRVPIRYPYDVHSIDTLERGYLSKNIANGKSTDPNIQCKQIGVSFSRYAYDQSMLLFSLDSTGKPLGFGIITFDTDSITLYPTELDMFDAAKAAGFKGPLKLDSVEDHYNSYWH